VKEAIRSRRFACLYAACLVCSFGAFVPFAHLVPYGVDHGITPSVAALLLGVIGIGSTIGRFGLGGLADRMARPLGLLAMYVGMALAMASWAFATNAWTLAGFAPAMMAAPALAEGRLVKLIDIAWPQAFAYYLVYPEVSQGQLNILRPKVAAFRTWILRAAGSDPLAA
jgi:predicted MFS family arabinose efflux permease